MNAEAYKYFQQIDEPLRSILIFLVGSKSYERILSIIETILGVIAFIVNLFHLSVLSRKQMRSSSVNVLMIGLALCDLIYFSIDARNQISFLRKNSCTLPDSFAWKKVEFVEAIVDNIIRRLSPWIGVVMAFTRLLISSFPLNYKIGRMANASFAVRTLLVGLLLSTLIDSDLYALSEVRAVFNWIPGKSCGYPTNYTQPIYQVVFYHWMDDFPEVKDRFEFTKVFVKYLPTVILPILTIGLIKVLRNIGASKQRLQNSSKDTTYQTTRLVTIMTGCLVITEFSTGAFGLAGYVLATQTPTATSIPFISLAIAVLSQVFLLLYSLNSMAHCFITWLLSSQYRSCAKSLFPCLKVFEKKAKIESIPMSFQSTSSRRKGGLASVS
ncbi:unnamed protein product [Caenorhabditis brenneri]